MVIVLALLFKGLASTKIGAFAVDSVLSYTWYRIHPNAETLAANGLARLRARDFKGAVGLFKAAARADPSFKDAWLGIGVAERDLGDTDEAVLAFTRVVALGPDHANAISQEYLGRFARDAGKTADAERWFKEARERGYRNPELKMGAVVADLAMGKTREAFLHYEALKRLDPEGATMVAEFLTVNGANPNP